MIFRHAISEFLAGIRSVESQPVLDLEPVSGFIVHCAGKFVATIQWNEVCEIVAFRYQGQRPDMMALVFRLKDDTEIETKEDSPRWVESSVIGAMIFSIFLPGIGAVYLFRTYKRL